MTHRRLGAMALVLVLGSCGFGEDVGPGTPECVPFGGSVSAVTVAQAQAVPTAPYGPCITELKVGWDYAVQEAESGRATFWLDSDRMGARFVSISLLETCDPGTAIAADDPFGDVDRFVDVRSESGPIRLLVVPVAPRHVPNAENVALAAMGQQVEERSILATVAPSGEASKQIQNALDARRPVIVIDDREVDSRTLELRRPGVEPQVGLTLPQVLEEIEEDVEEPRYDATWYHLFDGGCIVYEFDAAGFGAETVVDDIDDALGLFPLEVMRRFFRDAGYEM